MSPFARQTLSLALTFLGLLAVGLLFLRITVLSAFVVLQLVSVPAPNPRNAMFGELVMIWFLTAAAAIVGLLKLWLDRRGGLG